LGGMRDIPLDKRRVGVQQHEKWMWLRLFDTVYVGSVGHHLYRDAIRHGAPRWLWLRKLRALCKNYLIIDGPLDMRNFSTKKFAEDEKWSEEERADYTLESHIRELAPQFELVRVRPNEKNRQTAVFRRVKEELPKIERAEVEQQIHEFGGTAIEANTARADDSVVRIKDSRVKFDRGVQPETILTILNALPEHFAPTESLIVDRGKYVGDVAKWIEGPHVKGEKNLWPVWLRINRAICSVGLVETHFKMTDYKLCHENYVDVDVDMVRQTRFVKINRKYLDKWVSNKSAIVPSLAGEFSEVISNIDDIDVFDEAWKRAQ